MPSLRTDETEQKYREYKKDGHMETICNICEKAPLVSEFALWKIVDNIFPWDRLAKVQHMLVPKRHTTYEGLTEEERKEFDEIKTKHVQENYELIAEIADKLKTIPTHFHIHLIILKDSI